MLEFEFDGFEKVEEQIDDFADQAVEETKKEVDKTAKMVTNKAKDNAPEITGTLVRGYQQQISSDGFSAVIYNPVEYAMRIEYGFQGTDSLGRSYDQPGQYPLTDAFKTETKGFGDRLKDRINSIEPR